MEAEDGGRATFRREQHTLGAALAFLGFVEAVLGFAGVFLTAFFAGFFAGFFRASPSL